MALLEILDHYPSADQIDVPIDIAIEITFNQEVADQYLTSEYFRVYVLPNYQGQINVSITKDSNKVILNPINELPKNTMFEVFVAGDMDLNDSLQLGVRSVNGDPMDKNYIFRFTTGESRNIDIGGGITDSDEQNTINVISTSPPNDAFDIPCIKDEEYNENAHYESYIDVEFDLPVSLNLSEPLSNRLVIIRYPIIDIIDNNNYRGYDIITDKTDNSGNPIVSVDYHPDHIEDKKVVRITIADRLICNSDYSIKLLPLFVSYSASENEFTLYDPYEFTFRTRLYPMLTTIRAVKQRLGNSITNISNKILDEYILEASVDFICKYNNCKVSSSMFKDYLIREYITCIVAKKIITSIGKGVIGLVKQRTLGDLNIVYDLTGLREMTGDLDECINYAETRLFGKSLIGVKSSNTYNYPNRRRNVFDV